MTTSSPPLLLHQLHPVEQFLALLMISAAALAASFSEPPRVIRQKPAPYSAAVIAFGSAETTIEIGERAPLSSHTVRELQSMARKRGMRTIDGRPVKYCRKARLIEVLSDG